MERYRELADSISDVFFAMDRDLRYTYWNRASEELTGVSAKDAIGKSLYDLFPDIRGTKTEQTYLQVLTTRQPSSIVQQYQLRGENRTFEINAYPTHEGLSVFVKDITEHKLMEDELQKSSAQWGTTFDGIADPVCLLDAQNRIARCNRAMEKLAGKPSGEIIGRTCWEIVHGTTSPPEGCPVTQMMKTRRRESLELMIKGKWYHATADPILDEAGNIGSAVHIIADINEQKKAEAALKHSEQRLRAYIENAHDLIFTLDMSGRIASVNQAVCDATGYAAEEMLGKYPLEYIAPEHRNAVETVLRRILDGEDVPRLDVDALSRDGHRISLEVRGHALYDEGRIVGTFQIARDITEQKKAEETTRRQRDLLENTLNSITDAVFILHARDPPDAPTILECNEAACTLFGYGRAEMPDLILLDRYMPGKTGVEVCKILKGRAKTKNIPVLIFTASGSDLPDLVVQAGADGYFLKPFAPEDLLAEVKKRLEQARTRKSTNR